MKKLLALALASIMSMSLIACGSETKEEASQNASLDVTVEEFYYNTLDSIDGETPFLMNILDVDPLMVEDMFGLTEDMYEEAGFFLPGMSALIDEVSIVKASEGNLDAVVEALNNRLETVKANAFYPEHVELVQNAVVVQNGNYVMFAVGNMVDVYVDAFNAQVK